ncbi:MAG: LacI family DNA-binding transcriptional regulator [Chloroflexota bacterium]
MANEKPATSKDVAKLAGVSQPTVSRAFDPDSPVSPATRAKILEAAQSLGYQPNAIARTLLTKQSNIVGVVMANVTGSMFYPQVIEQLTAVLQSHNKQSLLFNLQPDQPVDDILPQLMGYQVDGLIIASTTPSTEVVNECIRIGTPVVLFNRVAHGSQAHAVCCDHEAATRQVAHYLVNQGYQNIAFIGGIENTETNRLRERGFLAGLAEHNQQLLAKVDGNYTYAAGQLGTRRLMAQATKPDAIFCAADIMALGAMDTLKNELGLQVPQDVAVFGFDDIPSAKWPAYNLSTISQPIELMVKTAVSLILNPPLESTIRQLQGELIIRGSA